MRDSPAGTPPHPSRRSPPRVARLAVVLGGPPGAPDACRVEAADRVMRVWALLNAADSELRQVSLPAEAVGRLHRQLEAITTELEGAVSGELAGELDRLVRRRGTAPATVGELRIEYASLLGWVGGLVIGMLSQLEMASAGTGAGG
jgi:proteasome activator-like protein